MNEDKIIIENITRDMALAQSADEIMRCWDEDVEWFDITARHLKGYDVVHAEFDEQFSCLKSCGSEFLSLDSIVSGELGIVTSTQRFWAVSKADESREEMVTRQTDCYKKKNGEWKLVHQHISLNIADVLDLVGVD